ncbi:MAG: DUF3857 and transglutaminase domain-containing protein [Pyrinomonadaceae bacterium]|nr:DUF3857 and transglutaminase domain-containing protein [Pyrinomonadaceae bacterium]
MYYPAKQSVLLFLFCLILLCPQNLFAGDEWRPVTPIELQAKTPQVEPDADAEAIFWEVRVDDTSADLVMNHYIRVKVFTERGREKYSKIDIPFQKGIKIKNIMARVIKPDGSMVELAKADIFEREIVKADKIKVKAKSFAVPNIESGVILEYRYQEIHQSSWANNMRMFFQHDIPIQNITYYFRPSNNGRSLTFNMKENFVKDKDGYYKASLTNVPAIKEESQMPPEDEVRAWSLIYYWNQKDDNMDIWATIGGVIVQVWDVKDTLKPAKDIKAAAQQIIAGATAPDEQLAKLFDFCKTKVKNITYDTQLTEEQKDEIKPNKSASNTYKKLQGTDEDINELFAALAASLGYETRLAFGGDRSKKFFNPTQTHASFVHFSAVGVKANNEWKYFDPGNPFVPYGMLAWQEEDTSVLLLGYKDFMTAKTPYSKVDNSLAKRTGRFKLLEDGTLEGKVKIEYTGQLAYTYKMDNYKESAAKREEMLKDSVKSRISTAEISEISVENAADSEKPFVYQYTVKIPNYAQKTGKRLFLQPGFFEYGVSPMFSTATRQYPIFFHFPWSENDDIEIQLPKDFSLDNAESPEKLADPSRISLLDISIGIDKTKNVLKYNRYFYFGNNGKTLFGKEVYQPLKGLFDAFHKADTHTITLKQAGN